MSYRIHLNVLDKDVFDYHLECCNSKSVDVFLPHDFDGILFRTEISDETPIDLYDKVLIEEEEYHPYSTNKNGFLKVLEHYQCLQIDIAERRIERLSKISQTRELKQSEIGADVFNFKLFNLSLKRYFELLKDKKELILDSDYFLFQYFKLVEVYDWFNDEEHIVVFTHG